MKQAVLHTYNELNQTNHIRTANLISANGYIVLQPTLLLHENHTAELISRFIMRPDRKYTSPLKPEFSKNAN